MFSFNCCLMLLLLSVISCHQNILLPLNYLQKDSNIWTVLNVHNLINKYINGHNESGTKIDRLDGLCSDALEEYVRDFLDGKIYALKVYDANVKIPTGLLSGRDHLGHFDECLNAQNHVNTSRDSSFKYCHVYVSVSKRKIVRVIDNSKPLTRHDFGKELTFKFGYCLPSVCNVERLFHRFDREYKRLGVTVHVGDWECVRGENGLDGVAYVFLATLIGLCVMEIVNIFLSTNNVFVKYFNVKNSIDDLLASAPSDKLSENNVVNVVKVFSCFMVIAMHRYDRTPFNPIVNLDEYLEGTRSLFGTIMLSMDLFVDNFFFVSGYLLIQNISRQFDRSNFAFNVRSIIKFYSRRMFRIYPVYLFCVIFNVTMFKNVIHGPHVAKIHEDEVVVCEEHFWSTIFMVQNYWNPNELCLGHTWYLNVDFQLYLLSPIVIYAMNKSHWRQFSLIIAIWILLPVIYSTAIAARHQFPAGTLIGTESLLELKDALLYYPTHARASVWLLGCLAGVCTTKYKTIERRFINNYREMTCVVGILCIVTPYFTLQLFNSPNHRVNICDALFLAARRVIWACGIWCVLVFAQFEKFQRICSGRYWRVLSRLTFSTYMIHHFIQTYIDSQIRHAEYFSIVNFVYKTNGDILLSVLASIVVYAFIERPFACLIDSRAPMTKSRNN